ncbi:hypothetical protein MMC17_002061 [Xylographa soralifera]|nr:hypothetical protein [Xylographa soralifera]
MTSSTVLAILGTVLGARHINDPRSPSNFDREYTASVVSMISSDTCWPCVLIESLAGSATPTIRSTIREGDAVCDGVLVAELPEEGDDDDDDDDDDTQERQEKGIIHVGMDREPLPYGTHKAIKCSSGAIWKRHASHDVEILRDIPQQDTNWCSYRLSNITAIPMQKLEKDTLFDFLGALEYTSILTLKHDDEKHFFGMR